MHNSKRTEGADSPATFVEGAADRAAAVGPPSHQSTWSAACDLAAAFERQSGQRWVPRLYIAGYGVELAGAA